MRSHLLRGKVRHRRLRPFTYELEHDVFYLALDLAELDAVDGRLRLLSRNRPNVVGIRDDDHLPVPATDLAADLDAHLRTEGFDPTGWRVTLVTYPRVLGYVFNPASFFLCRDASGALAAVVVEVHNTWHERHCYTLRPQPRPVTDAHLETTSPDDPAVFRSAMTKAFYVSPFIDLAGRYTVQVRDEAEHLRIAIVEHQDGRPLLATSLVLERRRLTDRSLLRALLEVPLVTLKTMVLIHWHALRLWRRGAPFRQHGRATGRRPAGHGAAAR